MDKSWIEEKESGGWPFENWRVERFIVSPYKSYSNNPFSAFRRVPAAVMNLHYRMNRASPTADRETLQAILDEGHRTILAAIDHSEADAHEAWSRHEVWLPILDEHLDASVEPAQMLVESIDLIGDSEQFPAEKILAAAAFWFLVEWGEYDLMGAADRREWALMQSAILISEAEWYRGFKSGKNQAAAEVSGRNKRAADAAHAFNRENKEKGRGIWTSRDWKPQADAEREIAKACNVVQAVAARWIREFKRAAGQ